LILIDKYRIPHDQVRAALGKGDKLAVDMLEPGGKRGVVPMDRAHDAINGGFQVIGSLQPAIPQQLLTSTLPGPTFSLASAVTAHGLRMLSGLALCISALSILSWLLRRRSTDQIAS
jgi:hypothetical protein